MVLIKRETEIETATVDSKTFLFRKPELDNKAAAVKRASTEYLARLLVINAAYRTWSWRAKNRFTAMAVIVNREAPLAIKDVVDELSTERFLFKKAARYSGWTITPTRRSDRVKRHSKIVHERIEGVLNTATSTKTLPMMEITIAGEGGGPFRTLFRTTMGSGLLSFPLSQKSIFQLNQAFLLLTLFFTWIFNTVFLPHCS